MAALRTAGELMPAGLKLRITGIAELPIYNFDVQEKGFPAAATKLREAILAADALLFASPEYNWSVGAPLKNAIDWMSRFQPQPFNNKPAAVFSCTAGVGFGPRRGAGLGQGASRLRRRREAHRGGKEQGERLAAQAREAARAGALSGQHLLRGRQLHRSYGRDGARAG